jgi:GPH family glycoside/pentoside/hexuronide:cation symporter
MDVSAGNTLGLVTLLAYSAPMVAVNFSLVLFMSYVNKYAIDVLLVPATAMGLIFGLGRLWDAVTDPMAGLWSDRTEHRWGRRRPWIAASSLPVALFGLMVWAPPTALSTPMLIVWMTVAVFGFNTAMTIFLTPHQALGAELTVDYHSVSRIFAFRQAAGYIGMIGCLVFAIAPGAGGESPPRRWQHGGRRPRRMAQRPRAQTPRHDLHRAHGLGREHGRGTLPDGVRDRPAGQHR